MKKRLGLLLRIALVLGCLAYAFHGVDLALLWSTVRTYDPWKILGLLAFSSLGYGLAGWRLRRILHGRVGFFTGVQTYALGLGVTNMLPARLGEAAKTAYLGGLPGLGLAEGLRAVLWERFFDLNGLIVCLLLAAASTDMAAGVAGPTVALAGFWLLLAFLQARPDQAGLLVDRLPFPKAAAFLHTLRLGLAADFRPRFLLDGAFLTLLVWAEFYAELALATAWMAGLPLAPDQLLVAFVISVVAQAAPSTPGGVGVYEAAVVAGLSLYGVDKEQALAAGLLLHMIIFIPGVLAGAAVLARSGLSLKGLRAPSPSPKLEDR